MPIRRFTRAGIYVVVWFGAALICRGQSGTAPKDKNIATPKPPQLALVDSVVVKSEMAQGFVDPLKCDGDGNLYLMSAVDATSGIRKLNARGERLALFVANSASDLQVQLATYFSVAPNGDVYQLAFLRKTIDRAVLVYSKDGKYKRHIKLNVNFDWVPSEVASFPDGDVLVAGSKSDPNSDVHVKLPFTALFSSSGTLRKQVALEDDEKIQDMAVSGDSRVVPPDHPFSNMAVVGGQMEAAGDGNVYLMRRMSPAIVYAVSPDGEVVKRFSVDPGNADYMPISMHIAGRRIAILFREPQTDEVSVKIVDLEGRELETYDEPKVNGRERWGLHLPAT